MTFTSDAVSLAMTKADVDPTAASRVLDILEDSYDAFIARGGDPDDWCDTDCAHNDRDRLASAFIAAGWSHDDAQLMAQQSDASDIARSLVERAVYIAHVWGLDEIDRRKGVIRSLLDG